MIRKFCLEIVLLVVLYTKYCNAICAKNDLDEPIAEQDGDYIIAGVFNLGEVRTREEVGEDGKLKNVNYCSYESRLEKQLIYNVQRALQLRKTIQMEQERFR